MLKVIIVDDFLDYIKFKEFIETQKETNIKIIFVFTNTMVKKPFEYVINFKLNKKIYFSDENKLELIKKFSSNINDVLFKYIKKSKPILH